MEHAGRSQKAGYRTLAAVAWLALGPMAMLSPLWVAPTSAGEDDVVYYFPLRGEMARAIAQGRPGLWNPQEQCGTPLVADPQSAPLYPPTWLFAVMPDKAAYSLNIFIALALAGLGAYLYLRKIGLGPLPTVFGATVFQYCGFMVGHRVHLSMICSASMLGFGLWAIESIRDRPRAAAAALPGIVFLALAGGHYPIVANMMLIWGAYLLLRGRPWRRSLPIAAVSVALAAMLALPHLQAAFRLIGAVTRQELGYATAGENSFLPTNGILALFPLFMGCRTQNFFAPQPWWGAWHLCETLGYVGLVTLALAAAGIWRLWRPSGPWRGTVRLWAVLGLAGGVWMLGYYLPPVFWVIHKLPVLNIVRAPARMLLLVDFALATLSAVALHVLCRSGAPRPRLGRTLRRWVTLYLPACMAAALLATAALTAVFQPWYPDRFGQPFVGGPADAWRSLRPTNPALWVPLAVLAGSAASVVWFGRAPRRRAALLLIVLVVDLGIVARHVDIPGDVNDAIDPTRSVTAECVKADAGDEPFRVLHLTSDYFVQPTDALAPKTSSVFGVANLAGYGPFQTPAYAHLFNFRIWGRSRQWPWLVRRNHLLSLYNVRYLICQPMYREVIESVVIPGSDAAPADGPNLLGETWQVHRAAQVAGPILRLDGASLMFEGSAEQDVRLAPGAVYRIELEARAPRGAANHLVADLYDPDGPDRPAFDRESCRLYAQAKHMGRLWRRHQWTFQLPSDAPADLCFSLRTRSERPIEVRHVALRRATWETPLNLGDRLRPGERVYELVAEVPPRRSGDETVFVYRNKLCLPRSFRIERVVPFDSNERAIEAMRFSPDKYDLTREALVAGDPPAGDGPWTFHSVAAQVPYSPGERDGCIANGLGRLLATGSEADAKPSPGMAPEMGMIAAAGALGYVAFILAAGRTKRWGRQDRFKDGRSTGSDVDTS